jgi:hypothetical protein
MAKRKKKTKKSKLWKFGGGKKKTKAQKQYQRDSVLLALKIMMVLVVIAGACVGMFYLDKHVRGMKEVGSKEVPLVLVDKPGWVSDELERKIYRAAGDGGGKFLLDDNVSRKIGENLGSVAWCYDVKVKVEGDAIKVRAKYYKPVMLIDDGKRKAYLAANAEDLKDAFKLVVLDHVSIYELDIIELRGVDTRYMPEAGNKWEKEDAHSAMLIVRALDYMDAQRMEKNSEFKPLRREIAAIDVSNFGNRQSSRKPGIVMYSQDGTPIYWGAFDGNLEAVWAEKFGKLYQYYTDYGSLNGRSRGESNWIELRIPERIMPVP